MAMPITLNSRVIAKQGNSFHLAVSNFGLNDSGFMVVCEYDDKFDLPWGVTMVEIRDKGDFSLFGMMIKSFREDGTPDTLEKRINDAEQKFANIMSSNISTLLNGFHGISMDDKPVPLSVAEFEEQLHQEVFSFGAKNETDPEELELVPLKIKMTNLYRKPLVESAFFETLPPHILLDEVKEPVTAKY